MKVNSDVSTHKLPYKVVLLDATDAYYYADIMGVMEQFATVDSLKLAQELAKSLFVIKNYKWDSLEEMNDVDGGWDVRVYDAGYTCVFAAHTKFKKKWIGK